MSWNYVRHLGQISLTLWALVSSPVGRGSTFICLTWVLWRLNETACLEQCLVHSRISIIIHFLWSSQLRKLESGAENRLNIYSSNKEINTFPENYLEQLFFSFFFSSFASLSLFFSLSLLPPSLSLPHSLTLALKPNPYLVLYFSLITSLGGRNYDCPFSHWRNQGIEILSNLLKTYS